MTTVRYKECNIDTNIIEFQNTIKEIHRVNKGWHCFETSNRFLDIEDKYLQSQYLKRKNILQAKLEESFSDMIEVMPTDNTGFQSISIKEQYKFDGYNDACHKIQEKVAHNITNHWRKCREATMLFISSLTTYNL